MTRFDPSADTRSARGVVPSLFQIFWGSLASRVRRIGEWRRQHMLGKRDVDRRRRSLRFEALERTDVKKGNVWWKKQHSRRGS